MLAADFPGHGMHSGTRGFIKSFDDFTSLVKEVADRVKKIQPELPLPFRAQYGRTYSYKSHRGASRSFQCRRP